MPADLGRKTIRRILIFDSHPDSLRLVFGRDANPVFDTSPPQHVSSWAVPLVVMLIAVALIAMFWPLL